MSGLSLAELQRNLQHFLLDAGEPVTASNEHKTTVLTKSAVENLTLETPQFSRAERLQIYHEAYRLRLIDALRTDFPALEKMIGEEPFIALTSEYITQHPSKNPSLRWLGNNFPDFVRAHSAWKEKIAIVELVEFEWAQAMAFDAADVATARIDDLRTLAPEQWMTLQLEFHPSIQPLQFFSNAPITWSALIKDDDSTDNTLIASEISDTAQDWLVWRNELQVVYRALDSTEAWCLAEFKSRKHFSDVCGGLCEWIDEEKVPMQTAQYLHGWLQSGIITNIIADE